MQLQIQVQAPLPGFRYMGVHVWVGVGAFLLQCCSFYEESYTILPNLIFSLVYKTDPDNNYYNCPHSRCVTVNPSKRGVGLASNQLLASIQ